jgi:hypothetical protein
MGIWTPSNPDISSGPLYEFGFQKILRQTKSVIVNILVNYFSVQNKAFVTVIPETELMQNSPNTVSKTNITRDFPFKERKFPLVIVGISDAREKKINIGSDNFIDTEILTTPDGIKYGVDVFGGMADIDVLIAIITTSPDERLMISESIFMCFSHFNRTQFIYQNQTGELFSIVPAGGPINFGRETEITDVSKTTLLYAIDVSFTSTVEYHFNDYTDGKLYEITHIQVIPEDLLLQND